MHNFNGNQTNFYKCYLFPYSMHASHGQEKAKYVVVLLTYGTQQGQFILGTGEMHSDKWFIHISKGTDIHISEGTA